MIHQQHTFACSKTSVLKSKSVHHQWAPIQSPLRRRAARSTIIIIINTSPQWSSVILKWSLGQFFFHCHRQYFFFLFSADSEFSSTVPCQSKLLSFNSLPTWTASKQLRKEEEDHSAWLNSFFCSIFSSFVGNWCQSSACSKHTHSLTAVQWS